MAGDKRKKKNQSNCGLKALYNGLFRRRKLPSRRSSSMCSSVSQLGPNSDANNLEHPSLKNRHSGSNQAFLIVPISNPEQKLVKSPLNSRSPVKSPLNSRSPVQSPLNSRNPVPNYEKAGLKVQAPGISGELDSMLYDRQCAKGSSNLLRASSGNVMIYGNLGNLRGNGNSAVNPTLNMLDHLPKTAKELRSNDNRKHQSNGTGSVMGNIIKNNAKEPAALVLRRALSKRMDPEELKEMGNEEFKKGMFQEALALYDQAIMIDPERATYWSNKAAALTGLGRLLEAVAECREAVKIEPSYLRAHHRLATLYLRLGEAEKAIHHYKLSGNAATSEDIERAKTLRSHLIKCKEARKLKDWQTMLKEAQFAISSGADSSPQVFASQVEALLKLRRHQDAEFFFNDTPTFDIDASTKFFGASGNAYVLAVRAQIDMASGRFDDAVSMARRASQLDPSNKEVAALASRAEAVRAARSRGNNLFKASKLGEACIAYEEGLEHDPYNSILLCNRAACRSKLGQWEKAIEDCNIALNVRPSYNKARLRRADCYAKLERWEASAQDYEVLVCEKPGDEEVMRALSYVQSQLKKDGGEDIEDMKSGTNILENATDQFSQIVNTKGRQGRQTLFGKV